MNNDWIYTGSIINMLEQGVVKFIKDGGKLRIIGFSDEVSLYPEMLRFLIGELEEIADELEDKK